MWNYKQIYDIKKRVTDTLNFVIPLECEEYASISIPQHINILDEVNKLHGLNLLKIIPYENCAVLRSNYTIKPIRIKMRILI